MDGYMEDRSLQPEQDCGPKKDWPESKAGDVMVLALCKPYSLF